MTHPWLDRLSSFELAVCQRCNQRAELLPTQQFYRVISRLGDGVFWYLLMALLPALLGNIGLITALHMLLTGGLSLGVYKVIKGRTSRPRPCDAHPVIRRHAPALDQYSFPSGHTMHAVGFTLVLALHLPSLALLVAPFAALVAMSRLVLGLHYPSDVAAGAVIGAAMALISYLALF
jgi:undecaprenyl-diphosphatase